MKWLLTCILAIVLTIAGFCSTAQEKGTLVIRISQLKNGNGAVLLSLYNKSAGFPKDPNAAIQKAKVKIENGTASVRFDDLPFGTYAVAMLHDENNDLKMNFNFVGMPKEGYGFSNNAKGTFGPPDYDEAAFRFSEDGQKIEIRTNYFL